MPKVLIGHPDKNFRYDLHKSLAGHKYGVIEADNGGALFTITKLQQPNFVITADGMASMSTEDYLKKLKEINLGHIPVIVLTTRNNIVRNLALLEMGAREIMLEPIKEGDLLFHLKRLETPFTAQTEKIKSLNDGYRPAKEESTNKKPESVRVSAVTPDVDNKTPTKESSGTRAENSSLLLRQAKCQFCKSESLVKLYTLRTRTMLIEANRFDVDCYISPIGANEYYDYSLQEVGVCHVCLFATTDFRYFDIQGLKAEETLFFSEFVQASFMKRLEDRRKIAEKISEKFFTEHRTAADALIAIDLAIHAQNFLFEYDKLKYSMTQNEVFQLTLKAATIAEKAQMVDIRNQKYLEAYQMGLTQMALKGELGVRRHTMQMFALSSLLKQKDNIRKYGKELFDALNKTTGNPQTRIKSREYADRAKKYFGWVEDEKYWTSLS